MDDDRDAGAGGDAEMYGLIDELDRPLMAGFMTAGYSELGRYIFLAAQSRTAESAPPPLARPHFAAN